MLVLIVAAVAGCGALVDWLDSPPPAAPPRPPPSEPAPATTAPSEPTRLSPSEQAHVVSTERAALHAWLAAPGDDGAIEGIADRLLAAEAASGNAAELVAWRALAEAYARGLGGGATPAEGARALVLLDAAPGDVFPYPAFGLALGMAAATACEGGQDAPVCNRAAALGELVLTARAADDGLRWEAQRLKVRAGLVGTAEGAAGIRTTATIAMDACSAMLTNDSTVRRFRDDTLDRCTAIAAASGDVATAIRLGRSRITDDEGGALYRWVGPECAGLTLDRTGPAPDAAASPAWCRALGLHILERHLDAATIVASPPDDTHAWPALAELLAAEAPEVWAAAAASAGLPAPETATGAPVTEGSPGDDLPAEVPDGLSTAATTGDSDALRCAASAVLDRCAAHTADDAPVRSAYRLALEVDAFGRLHDVSLTPFGDENESFESCVRSRLNSDEIGDLGEGRARLTWRPQ